MIQHSLLALGIAASFGTAQPTKSVVEHRAVFGLVTRAPDLVRACNGQAPLAVQYVRTPRDWAAAVFTGLWYTPVHVRVTCPAR